MTNFEQLVDFLFENYSSNISYFNEDLQEILMTDLTIGHIAVLIKQVQNRLENNFSFRIVHVFEDCFNVYIYNKQDISDNLIAEQQRWEEKIKEYFDEH